MEKEGGVVRYCIVWKGRSSGDGTVLSGKEGGAVKVLCEGRKESAIVLRGNEERHYV